jgi:hypothetical protein
VAGMMTVVAAVTAVVVLGRQMASLRMATRVAIRRDDAVRDNHRLHLCVTRHPGDDVRLSHSGRFAARDIVQFVPFARFSSSPALLAQETLAEIPRQVRALKYPD